jgi:THO complex subunit 1
MESTFIKRKNGFLDVLQKLGKIDAEKLKVEILTYFDSQLASDERKTIQFALQHSLNIYLDQLLLSNINSNSWQESNVKSLFNIVLWMIKNDLIQNVYFFAFIDAIFDTRTIQECERMFSYLEENAQELARIVHAIEDPNIRARVLKPLVGLMKRLSRTTDTEFCGRVLSFTAAVLPLSDPSGLNKKGTINLASVTKIDETKVQDIDSGVDDTPVDIQFWKTFWSVQSMVQSPWTVLEAPANWGKMVDTMKQILTTFSSTPLDIPEIVGPSLRTSTVTPVKSSAAPSSMEIDLPLTQKGAYFTKFLTSPRLIKLEIQDPYFRKHILTQFLIYLKAIKRPAPDVKAAHLTETQISSMKDLKKRVKELLENTPPQATKFANAIYSILKREKNWIEWKKGQCKSFEKLPAKRTQEEMKDNAPISSLLTSLKDSEDDEERPLKRQKNRRKREWS